MIKFDSNRNAILNPKDMIKGLNKISKYCILCFFNNVLEELEESKIITKVDELNSTLGKHKIYEMKYKNMIMNVFNPGLGGPMAGGFLEELIGLGCENFIACGGAGVLDSKIEMGELIVPTESVREEGTSYHYIGENEKIRVNSVILKKIEEVLKNNEIKYVEGKIWTTDAIYRETIQKIEEKKKDGCIAVEMEFSSMLAISLFRNVNFGQILYGGDDLDGRVWKYRNWREDENIQNKMFWLCAEILYKLNNSKKGKE